MKHLAIILSLLVLTGCGLAQTGQQQLEQRARDAATYADDNILNRREIRRENWQSIMAEARKLDDEGKHEEARALRCDHYPPVVTLGTLRKAQKNEASDSLREIDREVAGCPKDPLDGAGSVASVLE